MGRVTPAGMKRAFGRDGTDRKDSVDTVGESFPSPTPMGKTNQAGSSRLPLPGRDRGERKGPTANQVERERWALGPGDSETPTIAISHPPPGLPA